ncbi:ABC transporter ATP-binding protein [Oceanibium sediminis]|uniref:ABC transporter ATP-binding protein n=1 Tax=Oceanibium sediminis TaxID=2026339 RepID=UPI000DD2D1D7|nr:ABC transporter ATP-binding protein [Oceanibium sediminis]
MPTIALKAISKSYSKDGAKAVSDLDLEVVDGDFMCLLGPSGCGKTTTLRMIAGLENLTEGEITVGDRVVDAAHKGVFVPPEKREMGLVFQSYALWPHLTIEGNTDFGLRLRKVPKAEREERVTRVMKTLGIEQYRDRYPSQLSGGQQQRVALARMLAVNPEVLLLDEPLSNLDARLRLEMRTELKRIHSEFGTTIVFVTHDQWEAMTLATRIAVMNNGNLQQVGTPEDIYDRPANRFVAEFVGSPPINIVELGGGAGGALAEAANAFLDQQGTPRETVGSVGLRPESIRLARDKADLPADALSGSVRLTAILPTGGNWILELGIDGQKLHASTHVAPHWHAEEELFFHVASDAVHRFDPNGHRLPQSDASTTKVRKAG